MEAIHSSKMLVDFYQTTQHYNPEDHNLYENPVCQGNQSAAVVQIAYVLPLY
jgi:hypothetical protein